MKACASCCFRLFRFLGPCNLVIKQRLLTPAGCEVLAQVVDERPLVFRQRQCSGETFRQCLVGARGICSGGEAGNLGHGPGANSAKNPHESNGRPTPDNSTKIWPKRANLLGPSEGATAVETARISWRASGSKICRKAGFAHSRTVAAATKQCPAEMLDPATHRLSDEHASQARSNRQIKAYLSTMAEIARSRTVFGRIRTNIGRNLQGLAAPSFEP